MTISEFFEKVYPILKDHIVDRVERTLDSGEKITAYRVGDIVRIDIKAV